MRRAYKTASIITASVNVIDWITFNIALFVCACCGIWLEADDFVMSSQWVIINFAYVLSQMLIQITLHHRQSSLSSILRNSFNSSLLTLLLNAAILGMAHESVPGFFRCVAIFAFIFVFAVIERSLLRRYVKELRFQGKYVINAIIIGSEDDAAKVLDVMNDKYSGYHLLGLFETAKQAHKFVLEHHVDEVFICLNKRNGDDIRSLMRLCTHEMIRMYFIPGSTATLGRSMLIREFGDTFVLAMYREPLMSGGARLLKRTFDIVFSAVFLCTIFIVALVIVTLITKITMPGPVFFRQRRTGYDGREFWCYKFRSMKVNDNADTQQAVKGDERITKWGRIMRHTNIDEFPQFFNVLIGDMSVVGPRPHMLAHTEYYSEKISDYMVRHYVRPGITGWAQINGERGETDTVDDMARRVKRDIWYIEHWSFWLDIQIIIKTIINMFYGDDKAF